MEKIQNYAAIWSQYQDAWAEIPKSERDALLQQNVTDDCSFSAPNVEDRGRDNLLEHISRFQEQYPGASFRTHSLIVHHDQLLAEWMLYDRNGSELLPGKSFARCGADGRLTQLVGFWKV